MGTVAPGLNLMGEVVGCRSRWLFLPSNGDFGC